MSVEECDSGLVILLTKYRDFHGNIEAPVFGLSLDLTISQKPLARVSYVFHTFSNRLEGDVHTI